MGVEVLLQKQMVVCNERIDTCAQFYENLRMGLEVLLQRQMVVCNERVDTCAMSYEN